MILRYFSGPVLAIVFSFAYPTFIEKRNDPLHIFGFFCAHLTIATVVLGFTFPRFFNPLVPKKRREEGDRAYAPQVLCGLDDIRVSEGIEAGGSDSEGRSSDGGGLPSGEKYAEKDGKDMSEDHMVR